MSRVFIEVSVDYMEGADGKGGTESPLVRNVEWGMPHSYAQLP